MREVLKLAALVVLVAVVALGFARLQERKGYGLEIGTPAPALRLPSLSGGEVDLGGFRGKLVVLNFWASWCAPCVTEMPSLERLHRALAPEGLVVVGISADEDEAALRRFVAERGITFPILKDPGGRTAAAAYHATGYPETFVIDRDGVLLESYVGPAEWDVPAALDHFRGLLRGAAAFR